MSETEQVKVQGRKETENLKIKKTKTNKLNEIQVY